MSRSVAKRTSGIFVSIILISVLVSCIMVTSGQYQHQVSEYSEYDIAVIPPAGDFVYPVVNYSLVRGSGMVGLFDRVGIALFETGIDYYLGVSNVSHTDPYGVLNIHNTPSTVLEYRAFKDNIMKFELAEGTGAVRSGGAVLVGNPDASGEFVTSGETTVTLDNDILLFDMAPGASVIFRADPARDYAIGPAVAGGRVAAEMYLYDAGWTVGEDVVSFDGTGMLAVTASDKVVEVQVNTTTGGRAIVIHVGVSYLDYASPDDLVAELDGKEMKGGSGMTETLHDTGDQPVYYLQKTDAGFDVVVYLPGQMNGVITIAGAEADLGVDGLATLLAAIGIVGVAVAALLKTD